MQSTPIKRVISYRELRKKIDFTRQYFSILEKKGKFPRRVHLGKNKVGWIEGEVDRWIDQRAAEREAG